MNTRNKTENTFLFENLEQRMLLSTVAPFPDISDLLNDQNSVIRMETDLGVIDIEMFDVTGPSGSSAATNTVANFVENYVNEGDFERTFFHRIIGGFVLQGGGFIFDTDDNGLSEVPTEAPIANEFDVGRSNIERTIAMAKLPGDPDSATSQFFFNLSDNTSSLNTQNGGFTVFGRVANDASWDVVEDIAALQEQSFVTADPISAALNNVPTKPNYQSGNPISEDVLVDLIDVQAIKPAGTDTFFDYRLAYPEGYGGGNASDIITVANGDATNSAFYQVVARYEGEAKRDRVLASGSLPAAGFAQVLFDASNNSEIDNAPFAIEILATTEMGATLQHEDFGATSVEDFVNVTDLSGAELQTWDFGGAALTSVLASDPDVELRPYLLLQNLSGVDADITIEMTTPAGALVTYVQTLEPYRRGGLELFNIVELDAGVASLHVTSTQEIVAAMSVYDTRIANGTTIPVNSTGAWTASGVAGGAHTIGAYAGLRGVVGNENYLTFQNGQSIAGVAAVARARTGNPVSTPITNVSMTPGNRGGHDLNNLTLPSGQFATLTYAVAGAGTSAAHYVATAELGGDQMGAAIDVRAAGAHIFSGGGGIHGTDGIEVISVFNPDRTDDIDLSVSFVFSDGGLITLPLETIPAGDRTDIEVWALTSVLDKVQSGSEFESYGIVVTGIQGSGVGPVVASMIQSNNNGLASFMSDGTQFGQTFLLDDARFG